MRAYHTLVVGDSGSGKTTLLREMHHDADGLSIFINHNGERGFGGRKGNDACTVQSVNKLHQATASHVNLRCDDAHRAAANVRKFVRSIGHPCQVIVDEAQRVLPDGADDDNPVRRGLHEDRDHGVKWVLATQDPSDLAYPPLKQMRWYIWVGEPSAFHQGFLRYWNIPKDNLPDSRFKYVLLNKQMDVIETGKTQSRYSC